MVQAVLFDLDGTLLPMVQEEFIKGYFGALCRRFALKGYEPKRMIDTLWKGTAAMVRNDGSCPNRTASGRPSRRNSGRSGSRTSRNSTTSTAGSSRGSAARSPRP